MIKICKASSDISCRIHIYFRRGLEKKLNKNSCSDISPTQTLQVQCLVTLWYFQCWEGHLRICPIFVHLWVFPTELLFPPALALFLSFPPTTTIPSIRTTWTYFCWTFLSIFFLQHFLKKKNLTHLLIVFHQMISSLSCTEEERDISNEYQGY